VVRAPARVRARGGANAKRGAGARGFTLLEMLVALAVFSLAALALIRLQGVTVRTAADLDTRVVGGIVAHNLMTEIQTDPAPPALGEAQGQVDNGGRRWAWIRTATQADDPRILRIDLRVLPVGGGPASVLTFLRLK